MTRKLERDGPEWARRGHEDLPPLLRRWVLEDPAWRIVKVEQDGEGFGLTLIHVIPPADFHYARAEFPRDFNQREASDAVIEVLHAWYYDHGVYNPEPYDELQGAGFLGVPDGSKSRPPLLNM